MVVRIVEEKNVRCPDCRALLAYAESDVRALWRVDYQGGREKLGDGIVCPQCQEQIVTERKERT